MMYNEAQQYLATQIARAMNVPAYYISADMNNSMTYANVQDERRQFVSLSLVPYLHAIMGHNGSGKSTLSYVLAGKSGYEVDGKILFKDENIIDLEADERAQKGIFLAFQYPIEIPGVFMNNFLKTSLNAIKKAKGQKEVDVVEFLSLVKQHAKKLGINVKQGVIVNCTKQGKLNIKEFPIGDAQEEVAIACLKMYRYLNNKEK